MAGCARYFKQHLPPAQRAAKGNRTVEKVGGENSVNPKDITQDFYKNIMKNENGING